MNDVPDHRALHHYAGLNCSIVIDGGEDRAAFARMAEAGRSGGAEFWMQIVHTGRQTDISINGQPLAPSPVAVDLGGRFGVPRAMTDAEIRDAIEGFGYAARVAKATGFTGVQLHGAHGYLVSQFLSPISNRREDEWGGSLENRSRFLLEAIRAIRAAVGADFPVGLKLNSADFQRGGFDYDESLRVVTWLNDENIDLLEISGGTYEQMSMFDERREGDGRKSASTRVREAYFLEYAEDIRTVATMPLMVTGGFRTRSGMESALRSGASDLIGVGRPACVEPDFANDLLVGGATGVAEYEARLDAEFAKVPKIDDKGRPIAGTMSSLSWYNWQLVLLGLGERPDPTLPLQLGVARSMEYNAQQMAAWHNVNR